MIQIRRILCPTDLSEIASRAVDHAVALARFYGGEVHLLHVVEPLLHGHGVPRFYPSWTALNPAVREELELSLAGLAAPARTLGIPVRHEIAEGGTVDVLLDRARSLPADIVVMGTHGRGGFEHLVLGSVTEKVMRKAPCPVMTVPPPAAGLHPLGSVLYSRILCPIDFSGASLHALRHALSLAQESKARLTVMHAIEWAAPDTAEARPTWFDVPEFERHMEHDARERMRLLLPEDARDWCEVEQILSWGRPWREILREAEERQSELIVMGVRGRGALDLAVFGSTTQHVVRAARCPVMVIHTD